MKYVPDTGFIGRDETLLLLDRAFDAQRVVLLHAYAGQGKTTTAVEFARWYATTGGLGPGSMETGPNVLLTSFETTTTLRDVLDKIGQATIEDWSAINQLDEKQQRVLAVLRSVPLWIWDNVEPVPGFPAGTESSWTDQEQRELADFLKRIKLDSQSRAKVLLTSRRDEQAWLSGIPYRVPMPRMRDSDAARLAQQLGAERKLTRVEINSWQPLLDYCAGNPLTLRVIVGQAVRMGLRGEDQITAFVQKVRDGEQQIEDADEAQGRTLGVSVFTLGRILTEQGSGNCVPAYEETVRYTQRISDTATESIAHFNIGHAYKNVPDICNLDAAEAAYQRSLDLREKDDAEGRSRCIKQIGMVHHKRFNESRAGSESQDTVLRHVQAAESHYHQSLDLRPASDRIGRGPTHHQLGKLYADVGETDKAREYFEYAADCFEKTGNHFNAGHTRHGIAIMYIRAANREVEPSDRETLLRRAQTYAAAALRDFQHYEGRAAADEDKCQQLIVDIQQQLP